MCSIVGERVTFARVLVATDKLMLLAVIYLSSSSAYPWREVKGDLSFTVMRAFPVVDDHYLMTLLFPPT